MSRASHHNQEPPPTRTSLMVSVTIDSLRGIDLSRLDRANVMGKTATVSFSGSVAKMQIGTSCLCSVSGYPVVESRPIVSVRAEKVSWATAFPHLTLTTTTTLTASTANTANRHRPTAIATTTAAIDAVAGGSAAGRVRLERNTSRLSTWSHQEIPEILELRVRLGPSSDAALTGVCHLMIDKKKQNTDQNQQQSVNCNNNNMKKRHQLLTAVHDLPVRSSDVALSQAYLRVKVNFDHGDTDEEEDEDEDDALPADVTKCSSSQSESSFLDESTLSRLDLRTFVDTVGDPVPPAATTTRVAGITSTCTTGFTLRDVRRALLACQPSMILDDSSTIATHESWDM